MAKTKPDPYYQFFHVSVTRITETEATDQNPAGSPIAAYRIYRYQPRNGVLFDHEYPNEIIDPNNASLTNLISIFHSLASQLLPQNTQVIVQMGAYVAARMWAAEVIEVVGQDEHTIIVGSTEDRSLLMRVMEGTSPDEENLLTVTYIFR